jgi:hypothetical protein
MSERLMPLEQTIRETIDAYCKRDLDGDVQWHVDQFAFIGDVNLRRSLGRAYYSARYIGKLMEALHASGDEIHPFLKFQVTQYASIYEAVISYLLWTKYKAHPDLLKLETHKAFKKVYALGKKTGMTYEDEQLFTCVSRDEKTRRTSIAFRDKVDCAVRIGFVEAGYADDIKQIYQLRNLAHIETEAEKRIEVELADARRSYWRIKPFLERIKVVLAQG